MFMLSTGCRPQEVRRIESRHVDVDHRRVVFPIAESKGKRRQRVIYLDRVSCGIVVRLGTANSSGCLFRNSMGNPWTKGALHRRFGRLKKKLNMPKLCAYSLRHSYAHWALTSGMDSHVVSKLLGHADGRMLHTRYGHVERNVQFMIDSVNAIHNPVSPDN